jgi:hypothetical protein
MILNHNFDRQMLYMNMNLQVFFIYLFLLCEFVCSAATAETNFLSQLEL